MPTERKVDATLPPAPRLPTVQRGLVFGLLVLHVVLAWLTRAVAIGTGNDDATYVLLARSVRHFEYVDRHLVNTPVHSQYPPGYPAILALFGGQLGPSINQALGVGVILSLLGLWLAFDIARRVMPIGFAIGMLALLTVNPRLLEYAGQVRSEIPYTTLTLLTVWLLLTQGNRARAIGWCIAGAVLAALTRSIGVTLIGALCLLWLFERRFARATVLASVSASTVGGWIVWNFLAPDQFASRSYAALAGSAPQKDIGNPASLLGHRLMGFVQDYIGGSIQATLGVPTIPGMVVDNLFWVVVVFLLLAIGLVVASRRALPLAAYVCTYFAFLALWPHKLSRFLLPMIPFVLLLITWGAAVLVQRWQRRWLPAVFALLGAFIVVGCLQQYLPNLQQSLACPRENSLESPACFTEPQRSFFALARYVRENTPANARFLTTKEATFAFYTSRQVMHADLAILKFGADLLPSVSARGIEYIVLSPLIGTRLPIGLLPVCRRLETVTTFPGTTALLRIRPAGSAVPDGTCDAVSKLPENFPARKAEEDR
ncbi:MAG TPA: glycosyltransferase family 39 protein [Gemmatimonadales bacterium]|nr:glycosyltransferase family 39 protein [Gemmatimonadales bacterium]